MTDRKWPIYENTICPVCGRGMMEAVNCQKHRATIHMDHCRECRYFEPMFWQCRYFEPIFERKRKAPGVRRKPGADGASPAGM